MARQFGSLDAPSFGSLEPSFQDLSIGGDTVSRVQFAKKQYGRMGTPCNLFINFFKLNLQNNQNYFHYNFENVGETNEEATPSTSAGGGGGAKKGRKAAAQKKQQQQPQQQQQKVKDSTPKSKKAPKRLNNEVFAAVFKQHSQVFQCRELPVFDGEKNFYSTSQFRLPNGSWSGNVQVPDKDKTINIRVNITVPEISHGQNLKNLLTKSNQIMPVELQALDIIMRNGSRINKISLGCNFFFKSNHPDAKRYQFDIGRDPMKYGQFGYYQAAKMTETGLYVNVDRAMAVFTEGGKLTDIIRRITGGQLDQRGKSQVEEHIKSLKFKALHLSYNRSFIIAGFSKESIRKTFFNQTVDDREMKVSVYDYFQKEYAAFCQRYRLNQDYPCVQVGSRNSAKYFPIECVELECDEVYRRKLNPLLQGMVTRKSSQQTPYERFEGIEAHIRTIETDSTINGVNYLQHFGINIAPRRTQIKGRILNAPKLLYGEEKVVDTKNQGQWDMKGVKFFNYSAIGRDWAVINIHTMYGRETRSSKHGYVDELVKALIYDAKFKGINMSDPEYINRKFHYRGKRTLEADLFANLGRNCKLAIIIIPSRDEIYNEIKSISELKLGLITQCLNQEKPYWDKGLAGQLVTNLFLKINPKTRGVNNTLHKDSKPPILKSKLMFIGLDVTHPSPTDGLSKSIAACVATYTKEFDKCFHRIVIQEKARKEVVSLKEIVKDLLGNFHKVNKFYPQKIIVYRDGIGEGDFEKVITVELDSVRKAYEELTKEKVLITYIMVQKRHNTRFLPEKAKQTDRRQNIQPGTVVDTQIVHHKFFEFYLCSHAGMMGTSRPTKYVVLHDDNNLTADEIQAATYYTCYLYPRCTKASSIPPFVQYSHLLAKRGRSYLAHMESDSDGRSSVNSGGKLPVLSAAQINQYNQNITVKPNINGTLFFV